MYHPDQILVCSTAKLKLFDKLKKERDNMRNGKSYLKSPKRTSKGNAARRRAKAKQVKGKK
jgi:hypothetical protein